jgi:hypothetical protein
MSQAYTEPFVEEGPSDPSFMKWTRGTSEDLVGLDSPVRILLVSEGQRSSARIPGMLALCSPFAEKATPKPIMAKSRQARKPHQSPVILPSQRNKTAFYSLSSQLAFLPGCDNLLTALLGNPKLGRSPDNLAAKAIHRTRAPGSFPLTAPHAKPHSRNHCGGSCL